jgi:hypothetical protein
VGRHLCSKSRARNHGNRPASLSSRCRLNRQDPLIGSAHRLSALSETRTLSDFQVRGPPKWDAFLHHAKRRPGVAFLRKDEIARFVLQSPLTLRESETI